MDDSTCTAHLPLMVGLFPDLKPLLTHLLSPEEELEGALNGWWDVADMFDFEGQNTFAGWGESEAVSPFLDEFYKDYHPVYGRETPCLSCVERGHI